MRIVSDRRRFICDGIVSAVMVSAAGCGTVLHPERRGQPAGPLDWKIVALNSLGLLLFFVPGVIAFAVDFTTGTIYLPPSSHAGTPRQADMMDTSEPKLTAISIPRSQLSRQKIETVVAQQTGHEINLESDSYQTRPLDSIERFWITCRRIASVG